MRVNFAHNRLMMSWGGVEAIFNKVLGGCCRVHCNHAFLNIMGKFHLISCLWGTRKVVPQHAGCISIILSGIDQWAKIYHTN